jgi:hypothetical protein
MIKTVTTTYTSDEGTVKLTLTETEAVLSVRTDHKYPWDTVPLSHLQAVQLTNLLSEVYPEEQAAMERAEELVEAAHQLLNYPKAQSSRDRLLNALEPFRPGTVAKYSDDPAEAAPEPADDESPAEEDGDRQPTAAPTERIEQADNLDELADYIINYQMEGVATGVEHPHVKIGGAREVVLGLRRAAELLRQTAPDTDGVPRSHASVAEVKELVAAATALANISDPSNDAQHDVVARLDKAIATITLT